MGSTLPKLGKKPARFDPRVPQLHNFLAGGQRVYPPKKSWATASKIASWGMMLNDQLGDCVIAQDGHVILLWTCLTGTHQAAFLSDAQVLAGYEAVGGYVPGDPSTDQGCNMLTNAQYFQSTGFAGHRISAFATL